MCIITALTATSPRSNGALHWPVVAAPFATVTATGVEVALAPVELVANAVSVCAPSDVVVVSHDT